MDTDNTTVTSCLNVSFSEISSFECSMTRVIGTILIIISIFSMLFNLRYICWSTSHRCERSRHYLLMLSMITSSISVIIAITPSVIVQCLTCSRLCIASYCRIEGFVSYLNGCVHMFMLMMITVIRCATVLQTDIKRRFFEQHSSITVGSCWIYGLIFAVPPLFNWSKYTPEGVGFHCGLDWFDRSFSSQLYFVLTFTFVYFIPLIILIVVNIYVYCLIRRLLHDILDTTKSRVVLNVTEERYQSFWYKSSSSSDSRSGNNKSTTVRIEKMDFVVMRQSNSGNSRLFIYRTTDGTQVNRMKRLKRLRADQRFALATIFLVSEYLLSWTPYALVALLYLFNVKFIHHQSILMTICAFIAKISMILNPVIYISTIKSNQLKSMFSFRRCSCC